MTAGEEHLRAVSALTPEELGRYLTSRGWRPRRQTRLGATIWTFGTGNRESQVLVPRDRELRDYLDRIWDVIGTLAAVEERSEQDVLRDLSQPYVDTQYFHTHPGTPSGTAPILSGIAALEGIRDLMEAAAYSLVRRPAPVLPGGRRPAETTALVRNLRVGPTSPGSYVIAAQVPLTIPAPEARLFEVEAEPPFERRVLLRLYQALRAAQSAASEVLLRTQDMDAFDAQVENGVSSNLCRALAKLGGPDSERNQRPQQFEIDFSWAPGLADRPATVPVRFQPELIRILDQAADELGAVPPEGTAVITGTITKTDRDDPSRPKVQVRGTIRVETPEGPQERQRALWVTLAPEQFADLVPPLVATTERVRAAGQLTHTGKRMALDPLHSFELLGDG